MNFTTGKAILTKRHRAMMKTRRKNDNKDMNEFNFKDEPSNVINQQ